MVFLREMGEHFDDLAGGEDEMDEDGKSAAAGSVAGAGRDTVTLQNGIPVK